MKIKHQLLINFLGTIIQMLYMLTLL